ncbi:hypothetical protein GCM10022278_22960 [Allohahella marinimesophila]|uniref:Transmembrane protein n=2 Tax=Allohahella marinimesophila TaxID=1054972 RepID=A0ABP7PF29_9GAMM
MRQRLAIIQSTIRSQWRLWATIAIAWVVLYYLMLLLWLMLRFQALPNYLSVFDWVTNVQVIIASTPSWSDTLRIIQDEWVLEIGFMNYDYGLGISEWSLFLAPAKMLVTLMVGALVATIFLLLRKAQKHCQVTDGGRSVYIAGGLGAGLMAFASMTLSWVVCCASPTWVVGLAMLGLGVSTSLWLEPLGPIMNVAGLALLIIATVRAAGRLIAQDPRPAAATSHTNSSQLQSTL